MQKKNLWEGVGETLASPQGAKAKVSLKAPFLKGFFFALLDVGVTDSVPSLVFQGAAAKKYKFVITGHGKYEKVAAEDGAANGKSGEVTNSCFIPRLPLVVSSYN